jgi:hypothetical protein
MVDGDHKVNKEEMTYVYIRGECEKDHGIKE